MFLRPFFFIFILTSLIYSPKISYAADPNERTALLREDDGSAHVGRRLPPGAGALPLEETGGGVNGAGTMASGNEFRSTAAIDGAEAETERLRAEIQKFITNVQNICRKLAAISQGQNVDWRPSYIPLNNGSVKWPKEFAEAGQHNFSDGRTKFKALDELQGPLLSSTRIPRKYVCCAGCVPWTKGICSFIGLGGFWLLKSGLTNGVLGSWIEYPNDGAISLTVNGLALVLDGTMGSFIVWELLEGALTKPADTLPKISPGVRNLEGGSSGVGILKHSRLHKFLKYGLVPFDAALHAFVPIALILYWEDSWPELEAPLAILAALYYGIDYWKEGTNALKRYCTKFFYSSEPGEDRQRKALAASLNSLRKELQKERKYDAQHLSGADKGGIVRTLYSLLMEARGDTDSSERIDKLLTAFFLQSADTDPKTTTPEGAARNIMIAADKADKRSGRVSVSRGVSKLLAGANTIAEMYMGKFSLEVLLDEFGTDSTKSSHVAWPIAIFGIHRLFLESKIYEEGLPGRREVVDLGDYPKTNWAIKAASAAYAMFNTLLFVGVVVESFRGSENADIMIACIATTIPRFYLMFYQRAQKMYSKKVRDFVLWKNRGKPNPGDAAQRLEVMKTLDEIADFCLYEASPAAVDALSAITLGGVERAEGAAIRLELRDVNSIQRIGGGES